MTLPELVRGDAGQRDFEFSADGAIRSWAMPTVELRELEAKLSSAIHAGKHLWFTRHESDPPREYIVTAIEPEDEGWHRVHVTPLARQIPGGKDG